MLYKGKTFSVVNPSTEEVITSHVAEGTEKDVDTAVQAARRAAAGPWSSMSGTDRGKLLYRLAELYEKYRHQFAFLESLNVGKPYFESFNFDLKQTIECYRYFAGWADKNHGKTIPIAGDNICYTVNEPLGVVGLILPWNFPQQLLAWKLAPCLATGNTVVIKPAEQTPLSTLLLARLIVEANFPPGVINIVTGFGPVVGSALAMHMQVDKVGFTGSTRVGRLVQEYSAKSNLKAVSLELGGKSPIIVFDDVTNIQNCINDCYYALFWNAGQCCSAGSRIFVQDGIYDKFVTEAVNMAKARKVGDPFDAATAQGPQVSSVQFDSVMRYIESGKREGAKLMCGGSRHGTKGYFVEPTVFADVNDGMTIAKEEIFGPVMSIMRFSTIDEVVKRANDSIYGLVSAVYTRDVSRALTVAKKLKTGIVWVNTYNVIEPAVPWGGFKQSGHGRDMSEYTAPKTVIINHKL